MTEGQIETITEDEMIRQPHMSISGIDGRPLMTCDGQCGGCTSHRPDELDADGESGRCDDGDQDDPVLAAIREMELHPDRANNGWANHIRTAYLDFKVAHDSWIERANRALDDEFEDALDLARRLYDDIEAATAPLREEIERLKAKLEASDKYLQDKRELEYALKTYESAVNLKNKRIAELEAQLPKVVTPRPSGDGSYDCDCDEDGVGGLYRTDAYCYKCGAKLNWEEA